MNLHNGRMALVALIVMTVAPLTHAVTLEEYGVEITSTGLVDNISGLRWLDSDISFGNVSTVEEFLADGWRVATGAELSFLATRGVPIGEEGANNPLTYLDFLDMMRAIGYTNPGVEGPGVPWVCTTPTNCDQLNSVRFTQAILLANPSVPDIGTPGQDVGFLTYISEVPLFGDLDGVCLTCEGRVMLVRPVPLPGAAWLFLSALGGLWLNRKSAAL